jgi:hypothetical protein
MFDLMILKVHFNIGNNLIPISFISIILYTANSYTEEGLKGFPMDGGTKRIEATKQAVESLGGKLNWGLY